MLVCSSCHEVIGTEEKRARTLRLYKWSLAVQRDLGGIWETYSVQEIVSAQLLALIEEQATHKFLAYDGSIEDANGALVVSELSHIAGVLNEEIVLMR